MTEDQFRALLSDLIAQVEMDVVEGREDRSVRTEQLVEEVVDAWRTRD